MKVIGCDWMFILIMNQASVRVEKLHTQFLNTQHQYGLLQYDIYGKNQYAVIL